MEEDKKSVVEECYERDKQYWNSKDGKDIIKLREHQYVFIIRRIAEQMKQIKDLQESMKKLDGYVVELEQQVAMLMNQHQGILSSKLQSEPSDQEGDVNEISE